MENDSLIVRHQREPRRPRTKIENACRGLLRSSVVVVRASILSDGSDDSLPSLNNRSVI